MRAAELLRDLALKAANAPEPPGSGRFHYVHTLNAHLRTNRFLRRSGESTITGAVEQSERQQWIAADGSGRLLVTRENADLVPPSGEYGPGQLPGHFITAADEDSLTADFARLEPKTTTAAVIKTFQRIWSLQVVTPPLQRLLLLHLAECADLESAETPREFAGKSGVVVTHVDDVRHRQRFLAFNPDTGELIGAEEFALTGARVPVPVPAVVSRTEWLCSGYRETTT